MDHILQGFNSCCFAYGQTGSGKTHTMFGSEDGNDEQRGLIPRAIEYLCRCLDERRTATKEVAIVVSFLEIYCDQIRDLGKVREGEVRGQASFLPAFAHKTLLWQACLTMTEPKEHSDTHTRKTSEIFTRMQTARQESFARVRSTDSLHHMGMGPHMETTYKDDYDTMNLEIREDAEGNVFVKDLSLIPVTNVGEVMNVISMGLKLRATHETKMNQVSPRVRGPSFCLPMTHPSLALLVRGRASPTRLCLPGLVPLPFHLHRDSDAAGLRDWRLHQRDATPGRPRRV